MNTQTQLPSLAQSSSPTQSPALSPALLSPIIQNTVRFLAAAVICAAAGFVLWQRSARTPASNTAPARFRIDINQAGLREWTLMPNIGTRTAERIVADRNQNGPFHSLLDLQRVPGIGAKTVSDLAPYCLPVSQPRINP